LKILKGNLKARMRQGKKKEEKNKKDKIKKNNVIERKQRGDDIESI